MKRALEPIVYGVIAAFFGFVFLSVGIDNDASLLQVSLVFFGVVVIPLILLAYHTLLLHEDKAKYQSFFIFWSTYSILVLSGTIVIILYKFFT